MFDPIENKKANQVWGRRAFLGTTGLALIGVTLWKSHSMEPAHAATEATADPGPVKIVEFSNDGKRLRVVTLSVVRKTNAEWKAQLSPSSYAITRLADTERPFTGELLKVHEKGVFRCICCDTALFNSDTKFDSGTGWPSFWQPIAKENVLETTDNSLGMARTAVSCRLCDAHLGHVFDDGPRPTGLRYCMNSVALKFDKA